jgi:hypothetical protein
LYQSTQDAYVAKVESLLHEDVAAMMKWGPETRATVNKLVAAMRALIDLSRTWEGFSNYSNIFRAAHAWFEGDYDAVKRRIVDMYLEYARSMLGNWGERVA